MSNDILINKKKYKSQNIWRLKKSDELRDINDKLFPFPKEGNIWTSKKIFIERLKYIQNLIEQKVSHNKKYKQIFYKDKINCLLCHKKIVSTKQYMLDEYIWEDGLIHYIDIHNIKPDEDFIDFIFDLNEDKYFIVKMHGRIIKNSNITYLKLEKNQLMILDALMKHGGYNKKYHDVSQKRYSEHAGFLEIKNKTLYDIVVSGNSLRVDTGDEEIFLPNDMPEMFKFSYIFHTHPPTPKPGGRVKDGILYEFPSIGDILHFIDHYNMGKTIGSLVMAPEGLYNIRKLEHDKKKLQIDENNMYDDIKKYLWNVQKQSIEKYGTHFNTYYFYNKIAQNTKYIDLINNKLKKYNLIIDFYPRIKDAHGSWIVDSIYVPLYER